MQSRMIESLRSASRSEAVDRARGIGRRVPRGRAAAAGVLLAFLPTACSDGEIVPPPKTVTVPETAKPFRPTETLTPNPSAPTTLFSTETPSPSPEIDPERIALNKKIEGLGKQVARFISTHQQEGDTLYGFDEVVEGDTTTYSVTVVAGTVPRGPDAHTYQLYPLTAKVKKGRYGEIADVISFEITSANGSHPYTPNPLRRYIYPSSMNLQKGKNYSIIL